MTSEELTIAKRFRGFLPVALDPGAGRFKTDAILAMAAAINSNH